MGGIKGRKQKKRLQARLAAFAAQVNLRGFKKPGSNKK
jgi:hypothetical protein